MNRALVPHIAPNRPPIDPLAIVSVGAIPCGCPRPAPPISLFAITLPNPLTIIDVSWYTLGMTKNTRIKPLPVFGDDSCCATPAPGTMSPERANQLAEQLRALADPTRLRMLDLLAQQPGPVCVCDITTRFDQHQPTISHHLRLLREAGLVDCEKRGVWAYYWATPAGMHALEVVSKLS